MNYIEQIKKSVSAERDAIQSLLDNLNEADYEAVCQAIATSQGKVVFMGVGKSGHIGKKLAATFSSTGTPSFFVHSTEALHGDFGMIEPKDVIILISNSGNTQEVVDGFETLKAIGCTTVAMTSNPESKMAKFCDLKLIFPKVLEADHLNLAPTSSSTVTLVLGDAIACTVSAHKAFKPENFHLYHPGGSLGKRLEDAKS